MWAKLEGTWNDVLQHEFEKDYMQDLQKFLQAEKELGHVVYPPERLIFNAFNHTSFDKIKVVILGQDPYHNENQAHGLSFSVEKGVRLPPSLKNIYKELSNDIDGFKIPEHGDLTKWTEQGVFLLNSTLTVQAHTPGSHQNKGWEEFTDRAIIELSNRFTGLIFLLWGKFAQSKIGLIDATKHHIMQAAHPSPFSARNGFFGCGHFSKTNKILAEKSEQPIDWQID